MSNNSKCQINKIALNQEILSELLLLLRFKTFFGWHTVTSTWVSIVEPLVLGIGCCMRNFLMKSSWMGNFLKVSKFLHQARY